MNYYICETCGVQYEKSAEEPASCKICMEERQYVSIEGQKWTTLTQMIGSHNYQNTISMEDEGLFRIKTSPEFAIGQNAYLLCDQGFNMLWDCITYLDEETIHRIHELGGIDAIALSHPHYYSSQAEWAEAFNAPIYIHEDDQEWITRPSEHIVFWSGDSLTLHNGVVLHRIGGHFKGAVVLEWHNYRNDSGSLFVGDIIRVAADRKWVTFMYSYPNFIPLPANIVHRISKQMESLSFEKIYDAFHRVVEQDAKQRVLASAARYTAALENKLFET